MVLARVVTACASLALVTGASGARGGDDFAFGGLGEDETRRSADEPTIAAAQPGPQATAEFHSSPGDGIAHMAVRGVAQAAPGSRTGALFRSILVPGYGQLYNGHRLKSGLLFGSEVALLSAALALHLAGDAYEQQARLQIAADPSGRAQQLRDAAQSRYRLRDGLLLAATGVWVLNMADAYLSGGKARPILDVAGAARSRRELAPLAAIRPGHAILGVQGRF